MVLFGGFPCLCGFLLTFCTPRYSFPHIAPVCPAQEVSLFLQGLGCTCREFSRIWCKEGHEILSERKTNPKQGIGKRHLEKVYELPGIMSFQWLLNCSHQGLPALALQSEGPGLQNPHIRTGASQGACEVWQDLLGCVTAQFNANSNLNEWEICLVAAQHWGNAVPEFLGNCFWCPQLECVNIHASKKWRWGECGHLLPGTSSGCRFSPSKACCHVVPWRLGSCGNHTSSQVSLFLIFWIVALAIWYKGHCGFKDASFFSWRKGKFTNFCFFFEWTGY